MKSVWRGWIYGKEVDKQILIDIGIKLDQRVNDVWEKCEVSSNSLIALDKYWGTKFVWGLEHYQEDFK